MEGDLNFIGDEESEGDFMYVDDEFLEQMDNDQEEEDDFKTMKESDLGSEDQNAFMDGEVIAGDLQLENDSVCQLSLVHQDHVYCVAQLPQVPFNTFISGDGNDKCFVWAIKPRAGDEQKRYECVKIGELEGHTETVEFIKFNYDGKLCLTGGMNNTLRIWELEENKNPLENNYQFKLKCKLDNGPAEGDDINFVDWHPKGNAVICGGKDMTIYLLNGATGDFLACFSGHEDEVLQAKFTKNGKLVISTSSDLTIRVWSPIKQECVQTIKPKHKAQKFHMAAINCFALHPTDPIIVSGDLDGEVYFSNYSTGEVGRLLAKHLNSVESIAFCPNPEQPYCVSCGIDNQINIYDIKKFELRIKVKVQSHGGFTKIAFS